MVLLNWKKWEAKKAIINERDSLSIIRVNIEML